MKNISSLSSSLMKLITGSLLTYFQNSQGLPVWRLLGGGREKVRSVLWSVSAINNLLVEKVSLKQNNLFMFETAHVWMVWIARGGNILKLVGDFSFCLYPSGRWGWLTDLEKKSKRGQHAVWIIPPGEVSLRSNGLAESFIKAHCVGLRTADGRTSPTLKILPQDKHGLAMGHTFLLSCSPPWRCLHLVL